MSRSTAIVVPVVALLVAATAVAARSPIVPQRVRAQIARQAPGLAYVPTRMARGFRFTDWQKTAQTVRITFDNRIGWEINAVVLAAHGSCRAGLEKSFQLDGNKVYWSHTGAEQQAWRCVAGPGRRQLRLVASSPQSPTLFAATGLGRVVASMARI